jgi:hypothetical protein
MIMAHIKACVINDEYEKLDKINQYHVRNAWFEVCYGGCKYGIFSAACLVEALHVMENGLIKHCLQILFQDCMNITASSRVVWWGSATLPYHWHCLGHALPVFQGCCYNHH